MFGRQGAPSWQRTSFSRFELKGSWWKFSDDTTQNKDFVARGGFAVPEGRVGRGRAAEGVATTQIISFKRFGETTDTEPYFVMASLENVEALLNAMEKRPGMFWGESKHVFTSLTAFLDGYKIGFTGPFDSPIAPHKIVPPDFHEFVAQRLSVNLGAAGWSTLIREHTGSESEAFRLFFELRRAYGFRDT